MRVPNTGKKIFYMHDDDSRFKHKIKKNMYDDKYLKK
jgi:hypothetical protein